MPNYQEARVKLKNAELNKSKCAAKNKAGTVLTLNKKNVEDEELPHELFLTTRQTTTIRNTFAKISQQIRNLVNLKYHKYLNQVQLLVLS